jgi:GTP-binding protein HflX
VIDASHQAWEEQREVVNQVLAELGASEKPVLYVFNKIDLLSEADLSALRARMANLAPDSVFVSAIGDGALPPLRQALLDRAKAGTTVAEIRVASTEGKLLSDIHREAEVLGQRGDGLDMILRVRLSPRFLRQLKKRGVAVSPGS